MFKEKIDELEKEFRYTKTFSEMFFDNVHSYLKKIHGDENCHVAGTNASVTALEQQAVILRSQLNKLKKALKFYE